MTQTFIEARDWLKTWSGKLALTASAIGTVLADNAVTALGIADFVPEGWPRAALLIAVALATFITPMKAAKKDATSSEAA